MRASRPYAKASGAFDRDAPEVRSSGTHAGAASSVGDCKGKYAVVRTGIWGFVIALSCVQPMKYLLCLDKTSVEFAQVSLVRVLIWLLRDIECTRWTPRVCMHYMYMYTCKRVVAAAYSVSAEIYIYFFKRPFFGCQFDAISNANLDFVTQNIEFPLLI